MANRSNGLVLGGSYLARMVHEEMNSTDRVRLEEKIKLIRRLSGEVASAALPPATPEVLVQVRRAIESS